MERKPAGKKTSSRQNRSQRPFQLHPSHTGIAALGFPFAFPLFAALCPSESKEPASTKATRWFAVQASAGVATCVGHYRLPNLAGD